MTDALEAQQFWFGELREGFADDAHRRRWFAPDAAVDAEIHERFGALLAAASAGQLLSWGASPQDALSLVLVCDQFSRQVYRGSPEAYATDTLALQTARAVIDRGENLRLGFDQRAFLYMPFQHAESRPDQHTSVGLFTALRDATPVGQRQLAEAFLRHAKQHRDIVLQFGRFPHRNRVLGRTSTPEELIFLETAADYGQSSSRR